MMAGFDYHRPASLPEALDFLARHGGETKILAGGTDLVVDLRGGELNPRHLLDVSRLPELSGIRLAAEGLCVGAAVTLSEIESSDVLKAHAPALGRCALHFASRQVRNVATVGGNVAHCSPCGDTVPPLVIHEAQAVVAGRSGSRLVPVAEITSGPYACALPADELIVRFILKPAAGVTFADFQKIGRRRELAVARINMAAMARQEADGRLSFLRLALGACTPAPQRLPEVEDALLGRVPSEGLLWEAGRLLAERTIDASGRRPSAVYKEAAIQGLFLRMLHPLVRT
jgi:CO/xanthine dehydrogenase FAD-binding subunit